MNRALIRRIRAYGIRKLAWFLHLLLFPIVYLAAAAYSAGKGKKYYFADGLTGHLGGWAITIDALLRRKKEQPGHVEYVYIVDRKQIPNAYFHELTKRHLRVVENPFLRFLLLPIARIKNPLRVTLDFLHPGEIGRHPPAEWFNEEDHSRGRDLLARLGISGKDAWYVCFFARDNAYFEAHSSGAELDYFKTYHSCRNSDIDAQIKAMKFIIDKGGYVIRIGSIASKPVGFSHTKLIDYPFSPHRSDFADIYLPCHGKFIVGQGSGVACLSCIVDMPRGWVNEVVMFSCFPDESIVWRKNVLFIPKLLRFRDSGKYVSLRQYRELLGGSTVGSIVHFINALKKHNIVHEENSEDDILLVTMEMYNEFVLDGAQARPERRKFFDAGLNHGNEIWPEFLERHPELLQ